MAKTGPLPVCRSGEKGEGGEEGLKRADTLGGRRTRERAMAMRVVTALLDTSTMDGQPSAVMWERGDEAEGGTIGVSAVVVVWSPRRWRLPSVGPYGRRVSLSCGDARQWRRHSERLDSSAS